MPPRAESEARCARGGPEARSARGGRPRRSRRGRVRSAVNAGRVGRPAGRSAANAGRVGRGDPGRGRVRSAANAGRVGRGRPGRGRVRSAADAGRVGGGRPGRGRVRSAANAGRVGGGRPGRGRVRSAANAGRVGRGGPGRSRIRRAADAGRVGGGGPGAGRRAPPPVVLAAHVARRGIRPHPQVHGMAQHLVDRPARELHLDDEARLDPVRRLVGGGNGGERRLVGGDGVQVVADGVEVGLGEPGPHVARVDQSVGPAPPAGRDGAAGRGAGARGRRGRRPARIIADEQRAEPAARRPALGPAADDELLPPHELELPPRGAPAAGQVARCGVLDDQPLPVVRQGRVAQAGPAAEPTGDDAHHAAGVGVEALDEPRPALAERPGAQILVRVPDQVERDEHGGGAGGRRARPAAPVHAALDALERQRAARRVDGHDLAVEHDGAGEPRRERRQPLGDLGELRGLVVAQPGPDADLRLPPRVRTAAPGRRRDLDESADAVVLPLEDEVLAGEQPLVGRLVGRHREHRPEPRRVFGPRRPAVRIGPPRAPRSPPLRCRTRPGSPAHRPSSIPVPRPKAESRPTPSGLVARGSAGPSPS